MFEELLIVATFREQVNIFLFEPLHKHTSCILWGVFCSFASVPPITGRMGGVTTLILNLVPILIMFLILILNLVLILILVLIVILILFLILVLVLIPVLILIPIELYL